MSTVHPFKRTFTLVQHTPLIHFQHDQSGATLRATEVKPKLDRFLIKHYFKDKAEAYKPYIMLVPNEDDKALDYKLHIKAEGASYKEIPYRDRNVPMFFANMGDEYRLRPKKLVFYKKIQLEVFCLHLDLLQIIENQLASFFGRNNFGMRSTKGFGSFTCLGNFGVPSSAVQFKLKTDNWVKAFQAIDLFYKSVRGGINGAQNPYTNRFVRDFYMKPLVFVYAKENGIKWEKKIIKEKAFNQKLDAQQNKHLNTAALDWPLGVEDEKERVVRDVLGLSTDQSWMGYPGGENGATITKEDTKKSNVVDRFPSPITFKPIKSKGQYYVYLWAEDIPTAYLQSEMQVKVNKRSIGTYSIWEDFDIHYFFKAYFTVEKLNASMQYRKNDKAESAIADFLIDIYSQIQNSNTHA